MRSSTTGAAKLLPVPKDPNFTLPEPTDEEFMDLSAPEDEALLETGAWDDEDEPAPPPQA